MAFSVVVKRYSTSGGYVSAKAVVGKYGSGSYDVSITGSNDKFNVTYTSGKYAIEIYNPSGYTFSSIDTNLPGFAYGDSLTNGRYYTFTPSNNGSYYVDVYYKPSITYYSVRVRSTISGGSGKFGQLNTSTYDKNWSGTNWSGSVSMPAGTNVAVEVKNVAGYTISSVDYCPYAGEISGGKYFVKYGLSSNLDIVVHYTANTYTVSLGASPSGGGSVNGGGDYSYGDTAYISASPSANYKFVKWSDGNTNASRSFTVTGDVNLTAYFEYIGVVVNISSGGGGSVSVRNTRTGQSGTSVSGIVGDTFVFSGTPNTGYSKAYVQLSGSSNQIAYGSNYTIGASGTYNFTGYFTPNQYTISVSKGSGEFDSYHSGGTYSYGTYVELWVNVNPHYNFLYWEDSDGNRISPTSSSGNTYKVTVQVLGNKAYTIHASPKVYTVSATSSPSDGGSVSGGGEYTYGSQCTLKATPKADYKFVKWSDEDTNPTKTFTVTGDTSFTAYFEYNKVQVNISSGQGGTATVRNVRTGQTGDSVVGIVGDVFIFIGEPNYGYSNYYVQLDGSTNQIAYGSNYAIQASGTYNFKGYFKPNQYTVSVSIGSGEYNSYYSGGTYDYGTAYEMWVEINPHYVFHYWEDNDGNRIYPEDQGNNRYIGKIVVTKDVEYTLVASPKVYSISVSANPSDGGSVSGGGEYTYNKDVTLEAVANNGYRFDHWSDGSKENPHIVKAVEDKDYVAYFYANTFNVVLSSSPSNGGTVSGGGTYVNGTVAKLKATPNKGYKFSRWSDGNTSASRQITVTSNISLTAYFIKLSYNIEGYPIPDHAGEVDGSDTYYYGERAVLTAYPIDLHRFLEWSDGDSSNPKKFTVNKNISLAAEFERWPNVFVGSNRVKFIAIGGSLIKRLSIGDTNAYLD